MEHTRPIQSSSPICQSGNNTHDLIHNNPNITNFDTRCERCNELVKQGAFQMKNHQRSMKCRAKYADVLLEHLKRAGIDPSQINAFTTTPCPGITFSWTLGSPYLTYPFSIHHPSSESRATYTLLSIDATTSKIHIRSTSCANKAMDSMLPCSQCQDTRVAFDIVSDRTSDDSQRLHFSLLSYHQLIKRLEDEQQAVNRERLKWLNTSKALDRLRTHQATWKEILKLLGTNDVPALHRIFRNAKQMNWSDTMLLEKIMLALDGKYHPKNFSEWEFDLAMTIYEIGGGAALYALHQSPFALPCRTSLITRRQEYQLRISCGAPKMIDIMSNIETMFKDIQPNHCRVGITLSMDEIACDGRLCYLAENDAIVGLCEHATLLASTKMGNNLDNVKDIAVAIQGGNMHIAHEVFVAAFSRNDGTNYGARPVLLLPTCKQSSYHDSAVLIEMLRQAWKISPYGEILHGPIWSIASDGEPKRRPALYLHCMSRELQSPDDLFAQLCNLPGLNIWTGSTGETQDFDYKHTFKRLCKLLCTSKGILIDGTTVNKALIGSWLAHLTDADWSGNTIYSLLNPASEVHERIQILLSPKDLQDVPRAIKLLNLTADIRNLDTSEFNPSEKKTHKALSLLGEMLNALVEPFIKPDLSLSQQITSLIKFSHISCALFKKHRGAFMPEHLYSDLQCLVRTAMFRVAHSMILDPELKVYLCLLGDDVLETLFGRVRMIGAHSPNVDIVALRTRMASAVHLDTIFRKHPSWEQSPLRLKLTRSRDVDHLTPRNWSGELRASSCDLKACWNEGVNNAEVILAQHGYVINFAELFCNWHSSGVDLLRPDGGKYPGISAEVDRSLVECNESPSEVVQLSGDHQFKLFDGQAVIKLEEARLQTQSPFSTWMELKDGTLAHKKTILRIFMDRAGDIDYSKSHDRLLRVRYYSIGGDSWDRSKQHIYHCVEGDNVFKLESLFFAPICIESSEVSLAVLQCTSIQSTSHQLDRAPADEISLPDSAYEISGQVLSLMPLPSTEPVWIWDSHFVAIDTPKSRANHSVTTTRLHHRNVPFNGSLILPIPSSHITSIDAEHIMPIVDQTWMITDKIMKQLSADLIERLQQHEYKASVSKIPIFGRVIEGRFPYYSLNGNKEYTTSIILSPAIMAAPQICGICNQQVSGPDRQNHMGGHILRRLRGVNPHGNEMQIPLIYPCGFCGKSSTNGACKIGIDRGHTTSTCHQAYSFRISSAAKISKSKPCTNIPIQCIFCIGQVFQWKYNMFRHLGERHPGWRTLSMPGKEKDLESFLANVVITEEEEEQLGIPPNKRGCWSSITSDIYEAQRARLIVGTQDLHAESPRRPRLAPSRR